MCLPAWKHLDPTQCCWDFVEASPCRHDRLLTPFPAPLPSLENGGGAEKAKLLSILPSFSGPAPTQEPTQLPYQDKRCFQCSDHGGIDKGFRSSGPGIGARDRCTYVFRTHAPDRRVQSLCLYLCCSPPSTPTSRFSAPLLLFHFHDHRDVPRFP